MRRGALRRALAAAAFAVAVAVPVIARAEPVRLLVAVGHKAGTAEEHPLKYADSDATRVRDTMVAFGGVDAKNAFVLAEPTRAELFAAIDKAKAVAQTHKADEVTLVFYFSGHGDRDAIHLADDRVLVSDLQTKLGEVPAALRIAITDACRTTREKGFALDEPFAISTTTQNQASGQVWLHASSDGEAAQESDELHGAIFTHAWLNGLRGAADANGDSRVTLDESFAFAYSQTLIRSAKSSGVVQKPEAVVNLRELSPVVLTQTARPGDMGTLSLPVAKDTHFVVYAAGAKSVLSELWGSPDRRIALAVPPGRYVVARRFASAGSAATIAVGAGEERKLDDKDFTSSTLEAVAKKGDEPDVAQAAPESARRPNEIRAGWDAGTDTRTGFFQGPRASYAFAWPRLALSIGGGADFAGRTLETTTEHLLTAFGAATIEYRLPLPIGPRGLALRLGGGARAGWLLQTLDANKDGSPKTTNGAFVLGPEAFAGLHVPLGSVLFADAGATGTVLFLREDASTRGIPGVAGGASLGARF